MSKFEIILNLNIKIIFKNTFPNKLIYKNLAWAEHPEYICRNEIQETGIISVDVI